MEIETALEKQTAPFSIFWQGKLILEKLMKALYDCTSNLKIYIICQVKVRLLDIIIPRAHQCGETNEY